MPSDSVPRRHHYVPRWHLGRFSVDPPSRGNARTIWRYSKSQDTYQRINVGNAAVIQDYYSLPTEEGSWDHGTFERMTATEIDGPAATVVRKLLSRAPLTQEDRECLAVYVAFLHGRVPSARMGLQGAMDKVGEMVLLMHLSTPAEHFLPMARAAGLEGPDEELLETRARTKERMLKGELVLKHDHSETLRTTAVSLAAIAPILFSMRGRVILQAPIGLHFVIGDSPVTLYSASMSGHPFLGFGFGQSDVEVRTPLTSNHVLLQTHIPLPFTAREHEVEPEVFKNLNAVSWQAAHEYVFASSEEALKRVADYFGTDEAARRRPGGVIRVTGGGTGSK